MLGDGGAVGCCAVPFVLCEGILGILGVAFDHEPVTGLFGDDRCGGNRLGEGVPFDDFLSWDGGVGQNEPIDEEVVRGFLQRGYGAEHRLDGRLKDIDGIDLFNRTDPHPPKDGGVARELIVEVLALCGRQLFAVVNTWDLPPLWEEAGCRHDGAGEGSSPGLIDAGNSLVALPVGRLFKGKRWPTTLRGLL